MKRALTVLGETGDVTVMWDESDDERMIAMIQAKMDQGYQFFIIENRALGGPPMKTRLKKPEDALKHRAISIKDPDLAGAIGVGTIEAVKTPDKPIKTTRKAKSAKDAAKNQSVAVKPLRGG